VISGQAQDSIDRIFRKAANARLPLDSDDACEVEVIAHDALAHHPQAEVVVLTISSILFRLLLILQFDEDAATRSYFVKQASSSSFQEVWSEVANLCCGAINQELLHYFPDLGMSTPYVLSARSVQHLEDLKPGFLASYAVTINHTATVRATLCVCADAPLDFVADVAAHEDNSGELEFF